jgi:hypothetical protein
MTRLTFSVFFFSVAVSSWASPELDRVYGYKNIAAAVVNLEREPVHGEHVENELLKALRREVRFEFSEKSYQTLKAGLAKLNIPAIEPVEDSKLEAMKPLLAQLAEEGTPSAILTEVAVVKDKYQVLMMLVSTAESKIIFSAKANVENTQILDSFGAAAHESLNKVLRGIPFEASVIKRDGYRVVLDRGRGVLRVGMELPVYTIEGFNGQLLFEETGLIGITQVDENLSFGKILGEKQPREIAEGNKIRLPETPVTQLSPLTLNSGDRGPASLFEREAFEVTKGKLGFVHADVGPSFVSLTTTRAATGETSNSIIAPRGALRGELWLTSKYFLEMGLGYGMASIGVRSASGQNQTVGTSISDFRFQAGYRLNIFAPEEGPVLAVRLGYGSESYSFGKTATGTASSQSATSYGGILLGGGVSFGIYDDWKAALDINTLIFPGVSNSDIAQGVEISNVAAWDLALRGIYNYSPEFDIEGKILFQHNGATFADRTIKGVSQTQKALLVGMNYYF